MSYDFENVTQQKKLNENDIDGVKIICIIF